MTRRDVSLVLLLLAATQQTACGPARAPQVASTTQVVQAWLNALGETDASKLIGATAYPFSYRNTDKIASCGSGSEVSSDGSLEAFAKCMQKEESLFVKEARLARDLKIDVVSRSNVPKALRTLVADAAPSETIATTVLNGDGITFVCAFVLRNSEKDGWRVRLLATDAEFPE